MLIFSYISTIYLYSSRKNNKIYEVYFQQSFKNYIHAQTSASFACNCLSWHAHTLLQCNYTTTVLIRILCTIITNVKYEKKTYTIPSTTPQFHIPFFFHTHSFLPSFIAITSEPRTRVNLALYKLQTIDIPPLTYP